MRWFKHMTNSFDDEKLSHLVEMGGFEGYGFWWRMVEIVGAAIDEKQCTSVTFSIKKWTLLCAIRSPKFKKLCLLCKDCGLIAAHFDDGNATVNIPNILKFKDEWTRKKKADSGVNSGETPEELQRIQIQSKSKSIPPLTPPPRGEASLSLFSLDSVERDGVQGTCHHGEENTTDTGSQSKTDKKASKAKRKPKGADLPPYTVEFEACWKAYPNPSGKSPAWRAFLELGEDGQLPEDLLTRIQNRALEPDWLENAKDPKRLRFIPHMSTWLHSRGWEDEGCFSEKVPETTPEEERRIEIMGKYNFGMPLPGECAEEIHAKNARMELELNAAGL